MNTSPEGTFVFYVELESFSVRVRKDRLTVTMTVLVVQEALAARLLTEGMRELSYPSSKPFGQQGFRAVDGRFLQAHMQL